MKISIPLIISLVALTGCKSPPTALKPHPPPVDVAGQVVVVGSIKEAVDAQAVYIKAEATGIKEQASAGLALAPDSRQFEMIGIKADTITGRADNILAESGKLAGVQAQLEKVRADFALIQKDFATSQKMVKERDAAINTLKAENEAAVKKLQAEIDKAKNEATAWMRSLLHWVMGICTGLFILCIAAGIYLNQPKAFLAAAAFLVCDAVAYFVNQYLVAILILGGVTLIGGIVYLVYYLKRHQAALAEEVGTIEKIDDETWAKIKPLFKQVSTETRALIEQARVKISAEN